MRGGFTFKGVHSSFYDIKATQSKQVLSPLKKRTSIAIPGTSREIIQEDGGYEPRTETVICSYGEGRVATREQFRLVAGWLDGIGELTFDWEPNLHYRAYLSSPPQSVIHLDGGQFELEFTITPPFAYEDTQQQIYYLGTPQSGLNSIPFNIRGTAKTPVRIVIQNNYPVNLVGLSIYHLHTEDSDV